MFSLNRYLGKLLTFCNDDEIKFSHVYTLYLGKLYGPPTMTGYGNDGIVTSGKSK